MRKIRTPRGRYLTIDQYVNLAARNEKVCQYGHFGCAAWDNGPCMDELLNLQDAEAQKESS